MIYEMFKPTVVHLYYRYKSAEGTEYYFNAGGKMQMKTFFFGMGVYEESKYDINDAKLAKPIAFTEPFNKSGLFYNGDLYQDSDVSKVANQFIIDLLTNKGEIQNILVDTYYNKVAPVYTFARNYESLLQQQSDSIKDPDTQGITFTSKYDMIMDVLMDIILYASTKNKYPDAYFSTKYSDQYVTSYSFNGIISSSKIAVESAMVENLAQFMRPT